MPGLRAVPGGPQAALGRVRRGAAPRRQIEAGVFAGHGE